MAPKTPKSRLRRRKGTQSTGGIANQLSFGSKSTLCLALFALVYVVSMIGFQPILKDQQKAEEFQHAKDKFVGKLKKEGHALKEEFKHLRGKTDMSKMTDLVNAAKKQAAKQDSSAKAAVATNAVATTAVVTNAVATNPKVLPTQVQPNTSGKPVSGFMVLGMHRSGTSMLSGLLVEGFGYKPGNPLIQPAFDNEKGFFELIPAVLQNDEFLSSQNANWSANVMSYDADRAIQDKDAHHRITFVKGDKALSVLNNQNLAPWLQKDPRMCITMRTWLPYLNSHPAVIFTYRHPLEVAMSLQKRERMNIQKGLKLWIMYNQKAVQNSADLCRVLSNNNAVLADPLTEVMRISNELTTQCGVPASPRKLTKKVVDSFVDPKLQHNKKSLDEKNKGKKIVKTIGDCNVYEFVSGQPTVGLRDRETELYMKAMQIYCDFESGEAYKSNYVWPSL